MCVYMNLKGRHVSMPGGQCPPWRLYAGAQRVTVECDRCVHLQLEHIDCEEAICKGNHNKSDIPSIYTQ